MLLENRHLADDPSGRLPCIGGRYALLYQTVLRFKSDLFAIENTPRFHLRGCV